MTAERSRTSPPTAATISPQMRAYLASQLDPGEQVLWTGIIDVAG